MILGKNYSVEPIYMSSEEPQIGDLKLENARDIQEISSTL